MRISGNLSTVVTTKIDKSVIGESLRGPKIISDCEGRTLRYFFRISSGPGYDIEADADDPHSSTVILQLSLTLPGSALGKSFVINEDDEKHFTSSG